MPGDRVTMRQRLSALLQIFGESEIRKTDICLSVIACLIQNIVIKSRRMRWAGYVTRMRAKRNAYRILLGKPEGKNH
jgi:hypothetical protein